MNSAPTVSDTTTELRDFLRESLALLPVCVQLEVMCAIQDSAPNFGDEYSMLNHAGLLLMLAAKPEANAVRIARVAAGIGGAL